MKSDLFSQAEERLVMDGFHMTPCLDDITQQFAHAQSALDYSSYLALRWELIDGTVQLKIRLSAT